MAVPIMKLHYTNLYRLASACRLVNPPRETLFSSYFDCPARLCTSTIMLEGIGVGYLNGIACLLSAWILAIWFYLCDLMRKTEQSDDARASGHQRNKWWRNARREELFHGNVPFDFDALTDEQENHRQRMIRQQLDEAMQSEEAAFATVEAAGHEAARVARANAVTRGDQGGQRTQGILVVGAPPVNLCAPPATSDVPDRLAQLETRLGVAGDSPSTAARTPLARLEQLEFHLGSSTGTIIQRLAALESTADAQRLW